MQTFLIVEDGEYVRIDLPVERVIDVHVDCGCFLPKHNVGRVFELAFTGRHCFVRAKGDLIFRQADMASPITVTVEKVYTP